MYTITFTGNTAWPDEQAALEHITELCEQARGWAGELPDLLSASVNTSYGHTDLLGPADVEHTPSPEPVEEEPVAAAATEPQPSPEAAAPATEPAAEA